MKLHLNGNKPLCFNNKLSKNVLPRAPDGQSAGDAGGVCDARGDPQGLVSGWFESSYERSLYQLCPEQLR